MISKNAVAIVILVLSLFGIEVVEQDIIELISAIGTIISIALIIWNQIDRKDVDNFFWKKK